MEEEAKEVEEGVKIEEDDGVVLRVLVVDDSLIDRMVVKKVLTKNIVGCEVVCVDSGAKAMDELGLNGANSDCSSVNDQKFDIILTDYCMPKMTGYDLLKAVKENDLQKSIPVVIMSSEGNPQRISSCLSMGAEAFFSKPVTGEDAKRLMSYALAAKPPAAAGASPKSATKRKMRSDPIAGSGGGGGSERRFRLARVMVA